MQIALIHRRVAVWLARFELAISSVRGKQGGQAPPQPVTAISVAISTGWHHPMRSASKCLRTQPRHAQTCPHVHSGSNRG